MSRRSGITALQVAQDTGGADPGSNSARAAELLVRFVRWLDEYGELSHDPHDFWATRLGTHAKRLYYGHRLAGTVAVAPFVVTDVVAPRARSLVCSPARYPIADAHYALGFFQLAREDANPRYLERGRAFLTALEQSRSPFFSEPAWGYPFDWPSRVGLFRAGTPFITTVPYCYEAFEAGYLALGEESMLETMEGIARFAAERIGAFAVEPGVEASTYSPFDRRQVINASAYRGFLLTTAGRRFGREDWLEAGTRNVAFVLGAQRRDGSWPYALDGEEFIDNFHSCLVLKNLAKIWSMTGDEAVRAALHRGYGFYLEHLIDETGLPVPFARRPRLTLHRRDLYDYAEGITLGFLVRDQIPTAQKVVERMIEDLAERWQLPDGHFVTRELLVGRTTVPYHRWAQSQTFHALAQIAGGEH